MAHFQLPGIAGLPGWHKSNEPGKLERAGMPFTLFDPADYGIPGSFGIIYTNAELPRPSTRRRCRTSCGRR